MHICIFTVIIYLHIFIHIVSPYVYPSGADGGYMRICCGLFEGLCRVGLGFLSGAI